MSVQLYLLILSIIIWSLDFALEEDSLVIVLDLDADSFSILNSNDEIDEMLINLEDSFKHTDYEENVARYSKLNIV